MKGKYASKISGIRRYFGSVFEKYFRYSDNDNNKKAQSQSVFHQYRLIMANVQNSASSICGISIGTENCYVAVARQGGIEILLNEYSQRSTPAYVAFGGNQREIGVAAKQKQMMNLKNTCFSPTLIVGKRYSQLNLDEIPYNVEQGPNDEVLIRVHHNGEELLLTPVQVLTMLFTKLRQISGNPVDCVINCPNYFDFVQRRAMLDAATVAGLNPLRVISDMTAVALYYGFYRSSPDGSDITVVGFVDCGQTSSQAAVVLFHHKDNYLKVLAAEFASDAGGKHFDECLANYFIQQHNLKLNQRSRYRLIAECEKLKKNLSANPNQLPINIECLYDERDFSSKIDRATFEQIAEPLFAKIGNMLNATFQKALERYRVEYLQKYGDLNLYAVEIVGGTSRIPAIKRMIKQFSGREPSTTLNADEAVARGCALQCAILSPTFKVARELNVIDSLPFPVDLKYEIPGKEMKTVPRLYCAGHPFPYAKQISISSPTLPVTIAFDYVDLSEQKVLLAQYKITEQPGSNAADIMTQTRSPIKVRVRIDANCLLSIGSATISYENPQAAEEPEAMETEPGSAEQPKRKKNKTITLDLLVEPLYIAGFLPKEVKDRFIEIEANLVLADRVWKEKADARNALEEFIYEWRDRLDNGEYDQFIDPATKANFKQQLDENEKWLYEQDEQDKMHSKSVYDQRTESMATAYANALLTRKRELENRSSCLEELGHTLQQARRLAETPSDPEEQEDMKKFLEEINSTQRWFDDVSGKLSHTQPHEDPPYTCDQIKQETKKLQDSITRIQNQRKRRADERRKAAEKATAAAAQQSSGDTNQSQQGPNNAASKMDVDESRVQQ